MIEHYELDSLMTLEWTTYRLKVSKQLGGVHP